MIGWLKQNFWTVIVITVVVIAIIFLEMQKITPLPSSSSSSSDDVAPELTAISDWINSDPLTMAELQGKVVLIDFWTYSCINCIRTQPYLNAWYDKYADQGLVIVGVHTPEFSFEKDVDNVQSAVKEHNIKYPVALDNEYGTWRAYGNRYWPRKYLVDKEGIIRYDHIGEGGYKETEKVIQDLLAELGESVDGSLVDVTTEKVTTRNTHELYLGFAFALPRGQNIGNDGGLQVQEVAEYILPEKIVADTVYLEGMWRANGDFVKAEGPGAVVLVFTAKSANIVADAAMQEITVVLDNKPSTLVIDEPKLYTVFSGDYGTYTLRLEVNEGFSLNSFTFG